MQIAFLDDLGFISFNEIVEACSKPNLLSSTATAVGVEEMSKRASASKSAIPMLPLYTNEHPDRHVSSSPPASAYLSPDGRRLPAVPEEDVAEHFSFSTTLRRHRRRTSDGELEVGDFVMSPGLGAIEKIKALASRVGSWWASHAGSVSQASLATNGLNEETESPSEKFCSVSIEVCKISH